MSQPMRKPPSFVIQYHASEMGESSGSEDFESFLKKRGVYSHLEFVWACKGMRALINEDAQTNKKIVDSIYSTFITTGSLSRVLTSGTLLKIVERMMHIMYNENLSSPSSRRQWDTSSHPSHPHSSQEVSPIEYKTIFNGAEAEVSLALENFYSEFQKTSIHTSHLVSESSVRNVANSSKLLKYQYPAKPEEFAKELSYKLEALQLEDNHADKTKRARIDLKNKQGCEECSQTQKAANIDFSNKLAKAIEDKLFRMRQLEDLNFDRRDECRVLDSQSGSQIFHETSEGIHSTKRRKRCKPTIGFTSFRDCISQAAEFESEEYSHLLQSLPSD